MAIALILLQLKLGRMNFTDLSLRSKPRYQRPDNAGILLHNGIVASLTLMFFPVQSFQ